MIDSKKTVVNEKIDIIQAADCKSETNVVALINCINASMMLSRIIRCFNNKNVRF